MMNTNTSNDHVGQSNDEEDNPLETGRLESSQNQDQLKGASRGLFFGLAIFAAILGLVSVVASGYLWYSLNVKNRLELGEAITRAEVISEEFVLFKSQQKDLLTEQLRIIQKINDNGQGFESKISFLEKNVESSIAQLGANQTNIKNQLKSEIDTLATSMELAQRSLIRTSDDWILEDVLQLLHLSNEQLILVGDISSATRALELADERIAELSDPALFVLRRQLNSDIANLKNSSILDVSGVVLKLSMLEQSVTNLKLLGEVELSLRSSEIRREGDIVKKTENLDEPKNGLSEFGFALIKDLSSLIRIRNIEETQTLDLTSELRFYAYESVRAPLIVAQLALLRRLPEVYQNSLAQASRALQEKFDGDTAEVVKFGENLVSLREITMAEEYPDISKAIDILRDILYRRSAND